ncbi:MAG: hypothetical protein AB1421_07710 [Pseudomonadota bacterium]
MKAKTTLPPLAALVLAGLLATGSAQACMPFFSAPAGNPAACAQGQVPQQAQTPLHGSQSCPTSGSTESGGCALINPELVTALGDMAAGGMRIATHMAQVLAREVGRYAAQGDDGQ